MCWGYQFYLFLCICVFRISVLPLSMYLFVEDIGCTFFYVFVCWVYRFYLFLWFACWGYSFYFFLRIYMLKISVYLFLCICMLRISVWPLSMYLCVAGIGFTPFYVFVCWGYRFTSFYVFVCWGYRFSLFLNICLLRISVLPLSMYLCFEDIGFTSFYDFVCWK